jgi:flagellar basal-body rod protein FlgC
MVNILSGIDSTTSALNAERVRLDVISENIANAHSTRGPNGKPYQRQVVVFETALQNAMDCGTGSQAPAVRVSRIDKDSRPPLMVHDPGHPDADANGMVAMPNINVHEEMADLIIASRAFEANLAVVKNARAMALQTLAIGKH